MAAFLMRMLSVSTHDGGGGISVKRENNVEKEKITVLKIMKNMINS
jgi:hypothetical protein